MRGYVFILVALAFVAVGARAQACTGAVACTTCTSLSGCYWCGSPVVGICTSSSDCLGGSSPLASSQCYTGSTSNANQNAQNGITIALAVVLPILLIGFIVTVVVKCYMYHHRKLQQQTTVIVVNGQPAAAPPTAYPMQYAQPPPVYAEEIKA
jgi:hypothetical protein